MAIARRPIDPARRGRHSTSIERFPRSMPMWPRSVGVGMMIRWPVRNTLYADCVAAAGKARGLFTLSAPTGGAKTLAMLAFALHHARKYDLRRIVLVMPFLNIIDQTARIYRSIFCLGNGSPPHTVLEHHSLADRGEQRPGGTEDEMGDLGRLLTENWDAPIILTTTIQFFESLMADRPSRCRKLHRLAQASFCLMRRDTSTSVGRAHFGHSLSAYGAQWAV